MISLPPGTEMFHFPGLALPTLCIQVGVLWLHHSGLPHSEILESTFARNSSRLIAAGHVLHRLLMPRHPPYALIHLFEHLLLEMSDSILLASSTEFFVCAISRLSKINAPLQRQEEALSWIKRGLVPGFHRIGKMVEVNGIEPMTSCLQSRCSPN